MALKLVRIEVLQVLLVSHLRQSRFEARRQRDLKAVTAATFLDMSVIPLLALIFCRRAFVRAKGRARYSSLAYLLGVFHAQTSG